MVANLPAFLTGREQWQVFWQFNSDRGADLGSLWLVLAQARDLALQAEHHQHRLVGAARAVVRWACWCSGCGRRRRRGWPSWGS